VIGMAGEPGLKLAGARAMLTEDGKPVLLENRHGKGRAYLLNYFLDAYPKERLAGRTEPELQKMRKVLSSVGVSPKIRLTSLAGDPVTDVETYLFKAGSTRLVGLIPNAYMPEKRTVRISFDGDAAIYDVRNKRALGFGDFFDVELEPAVPKLFALADQRITGIELQAPSEARLGEEVKVSFRIKGASAQRSVARIVVTDPSGKRLRYYSGNREISNGAGNASFRTALNDAKGGWEVEVTDVISGEEDRSLINIR
jgi:hypothetical protein